MKFLLTFLLSAATLAASAEIHTVNGRKVECKDGVCRLVEDPPAAAQAAAPAVASSPSPRRTRIAQGYMSADKFIAFLENRDTDPLDGAGFWLVLLLTLLGGVAMNLTPCVLPMIPINLIIIGRSAKRGAAYGLGMAIAYGALGAAAAGGALAFGDIQGNPWFNAAVALVFLALALSLFGVFFIDLSRFRPNISTHPSSLTSHPSSLTSHPSSLTSHPSSLIPPFFMGALSAVLAGACVAPVLISVLLLTAELVSGGHRFAILLPFLLGLGMGLPWPFVGAGLKILPKPGAWMRHVNRLFGLVVLGLAVWYAILSFRGFTSRPSSPIPHPPSLIPHPPSLIPHPSLLIPHLSSLISHPSPKPILVDCWASWCKNCAAMERVLEEDRVKKALQSYEVLRVRAEDLSELRKIAGFEQIRGLPAFVIIER